MRLSKRMFSIACLSAALATGTAFVAAKAADLAPRTIASATQFVYGNVERRGVAVFNGTLLIRTDGCWFADTDLSNGTDHPRAVSISYRWTGRQGRTVAHIAAVRGEVLAPGERQSVRTSGCSTAIARNYAFLASQQAARIISSRPAR